jgi:hypothetical protein
VLRAEVLPATAGESVAARRGETIWKGEESYAIHGDAGEGRLIVGVGADQFPSAWRLYDGGTRNLGPVRDARPIMYLDKFDAVWERTADGDVLHVVPGARTVPAPRFTGAAGAVSILAGDRNAGALWIHAPVEGGVAYASWTPGNVDPPVAAGVLPVDILRTHGASPAGNPLAIGQRRDSPDQRVWELTPAAVELTFPNARANAGPWPIFIDRRRGSGVSELRDVRNDQTWTVTGRLGDIDWRGGTEEPLRRFGTEGPVDGWLDAVIWSPERVWRWREYFPRAARGSARVRRGRFRVTTSLWETPVGRIVDLVRPRIIEFAPARVISAERNEVLLRRQHGSSQTVLILDMEAGTIRPVTTVSNCTGLVSAKLVGTPARHLSVSCSLRDPTGPHVYTLSQHAVVDLATGKTCRSPHTIEAVLETGVLLASDRTTNGAESRPTFHELFELRCP